MKKKSLLVMLAGTFLYLTLASDSNGPGGNKTGSHGSSASCGSCHGNSATTGLNMSIVLDSAGTAVTEYVPGGSYTIKMTGTHHITGTTNLSKFGFQLSAVLGSGSTSTQAGTWGTLPSSSHITTSSGISIVEHSAKWSPASGSGDTGTVYTVSIPWTAPVSGSGTVKVYGILNAVNNNGNDGTTDKWNTLNVSIAERVASSTGLATVAANAPVVYPNPVLNVLNINNLPNNSMVVVYDLSGKVIANVTATGTTGINTENWASGMYFVHIMANGNRVVNTVVKQ